jgi:hypothetical protein
MTALAVYGKNVHKFVRVFKGEVVILYFQVPTVHIQCFGSGSGWIHIQFGPGSGSGSVFGIRIRIPDPNV